MASVVLAGGASRRMRADKRLLRLGGETLLERAARIAGGVSRPVYVAGAEAPLGSGAVGVSDELPGAGPLAGVVAGMRAAGPGLHLCIACDLPLLQPEILIMLLLKSEGFAGAVPVVGGHPEPLCAAYRAECAEAFGEALEEGERAVHRTLNRLRLCHIPEAELRAADPELRSFWNANTPEDWQRILSVSGP